MYSVGKKKRKKTCSTTCVQRAVLELSHHQSSSTSAHGTHKMEVGFGLFFFMTVHL